MIKEILKTLGKLKLKELLFAFEVGQSYFVKLDDDEKFIGVNIPESGPYTIIEKEGAWSYGYIRKDS